MNKKIAIVTHGHLAKGYESALSILVGKQEGIELTAISAYVDEYKDWQKELDILFNECTANQINIIFTDIYGGSVNQNVFLQYNEKPVTIVSGINLPIVMEVLLTPFDTVSEFTKRINTMIDDSREQLKITKKEETEENFF